MFFPVVPGRRSLVRVEGNSVRPPGAAIPRPVRGAILNWFEDRGVSKRAIWDRLSLEEGFSRADDLIERVEERYGREVAEEMRSGIREIAATESEAVKAPYRTAQQRRQVSWKVFVENLPRYAFETVPDPEFATAIEWGLILLEEMRRASLTVGEVGNVQVEDAREYLDRLFEKRSIPYRTSSQGKIEWYGDRATHELVIAPALGVLADPRLAGAKDEFEAALGHLRVGRVKDLEDTIEEAAKAVESAMKVLLDARGVSRKPTLTAKPLFDALKTNGIVPPYMEKVVLATSAIRNTEGGHGAGPRPREIPTELAEAALSGAGVAIGFLAKKLP